MDHPLNLKTWEKPKNFPKKIDSKLAWDFCVYGYQSGIEPCQHEDSFFEEILGESLENLFPIAMLIIPALNWERPIKYMDRPQPLNLTPFAVHDMGGVNPATIYVGDVTFEFPDDVLFPNIRGNKDGMPFYTKGYRSALALVASGPEMALAMRMNADITARTGMYFNSIPVPGDPLMRSDFAIRSIVKELLTKNLYPYQKGKPELQREPGLSAWESFISKLCEMGYEQMYDPFYAMMVTAIIRTEAFAKLNKYEVPYSRTDYASTEEFADAYPVEEFFPELPLDLMKQLSLHKMQYTLSSWMQKPNLYH